MFEIERYKFNCVSTRSIAYQFLITRRSLSLVSKSGAAYSRSHLACLARAHFALCAHENFHKKKCVSIDSKCSETHKNAHKIFYPFDPLRALRIAQNPADVAQLNFNTINRTEVPTISPTLIKIRPIVSEI